MIGESAISIDWIQFTSLDLSLNEVVSKVLKMEIRLFQELEKGKLGYKKQLFYKNISVLFDGNENMGIHVILTGKGCNFYSNVERPILLLMADINQLKCKVTRIDIAIDDYKGDIINLKAIHKDTINGEVISRWKSSTEFTKRTIKGKVIGKTIAFGSRSSNIYLRIYDKLLEQANYQNLKGVEVWNRLELEIKKESAEEIQRLIKNKTLNEIAKGILVNNIRFVVPEKTKNKSRWKTKRHWLNLIDGIEKIQLNQTKKVTEIDRTKIWLQKQVAQSLGKVALIDGDMEFIDKITVEGAKKLKRSGFNANDFD